MVDLLSNIIPLIWKSLKKKILEKKIWILF